MLFRVELLSSAIAALALSAGCGAHQPAASQAPQAAATPSSTDSTDSTATDEASETGRDELEFTQLGEGVWMHTSWKDVPPWGPVMSNGLIVADGEGSFLIDTAWNDEQTAAILDWAERELGRPVRGAVFTHAHEDKMGGVGAVRARGIRTYALALSNQLAAEGGVMPAEASLRLEAGGEPQTLGPVQVFYPGGGHTRDNIVVAVDGGVLFGGCLIRPGGTNSLGNTADADLDHWDEAVSAVAKRFPDRSVVIPSHGPPGGRELLDQTIQLVQSDEKKP